MGVPAPEDACYPLPEMETASSSRVVGASRLGTLGLLKRGTWTERAVPRKHAVGMASHLVFSSSLATPTPGPDQHVCPVFTWDLLNTRVSGRKGLCLGKGRDAKGVDESLTT